MPSLDVTTTEWALVIVVTVLAVLIMLLPNKGP